MKQSVTRRGKGRCSGPGRRPGTFACRAGTLAAGRPPGRSTGAGAAEGSSGWSRHEICRGIERAGRLLAEEPGLARLVALAGSRGAALHLVGGAVRDPLLDRPPADLDIVVGGDAHELARAFADAVGGRLVLLEEKPPTFRVVRPGVPAPAGLVDLTGYRGATLEDDLALRDFTVNAIALPLVPLLAGEVPAPIDPTGGLADLAARRLRMTGPRAFDDDPLRPLRAYRLVAELGFRLDPRTARAATARAGLLARVSAERVAAESFRLLSLPETRRWVVALGRAGLLGPALRLETPPAAGWRDALGRLETLLADPAVALGEAAGAAALDVRARLAQPLAAGRPRLALLRFALVAGAGAPAAGARLRLAVREIRWISAVQAAREPIALLAAAERVDPALLVRVLVRPLGEEAGAALLYADAAAPPGRRAATRRFVAAALTMLAQVVGPRLAAPRPVSGEDLIRVLGIAPGPAVGRLLEWLDEARAAGIVTDREGALAFARAHLDEACRGGKRTV